MRIPRTDKRKPYVGVFDEKPSKFFKESDKEWVERNMKACVWFLENRDKLARITKGL